MAIISPAHQGDIIHKSYTLSLMKEHVCGRRCTGRPMDVVWGAVAGQTGTAPNLTRP